MKAKNISRFLTVTVLGVIAFSVYQDVYAGESRYVTDAELLELNEMSADSEAIEAHEKTEKGKETKEILVCWSADKQRLVPVYMGCK